MIELIYSLNIFDEERKRRPLLLTLFLFTTLISETTSKKSVPPGMDPDLFPTPVFDNNKAFCQAEREPCGFYSFSLRGKAPFKWIKSWCHCNTGFSCVYERTDMKMRVYKHYCVSDDKVDLEEKVQEHQSEDNYTTDVDYDYQTSGRPHTHRKHHASNGLRKRRAESADFIA